MIRNITYKGVLIGGSTIPGETPGDGMTPNYCQGMRVSAKRWLLLYDTVDCRGRDCWRAIFYQIRDGAPDGPIVTEKQLVDMTPMGTLTDGTELLISHGQPAVFGWGRDAPAGAPNANAVDEAADLFLAEAVLRARMECVPS